MLINFNLIYTNNLNPTEVFILYAINQKEFDFIKEDYINDVNNLIGMGYVTESSKISDLRLTKSGKAFLTSLSKLDSSNENCELVERLIEMYEFYNKETGNYLEIQDRLNWFIKVTGFSTKVIEDSIKNYLKENDKYIMRLDNLIWKPQSAAFSVNFSLSDSRLFDMIVKKYKLPFYFYTDKKRRSRVKESWLYDISKLKVPTKLPSEMYWTGSEKGDKEAYARLKNQFVNNILKE